MPRKKVMAANWKMYKNPTQTLAFFQEFLPMVAGHTRDEIVVCPPYIDLYVAIAEVKGSLVAVGAQDLVLTHPHPVIAIDLAAGKGGDGAAFRVRFGGHCFTSRSRYSRKRPTSDAGPLTDNLT